MSTYEELVAQRDSLEAKCRILEARAADVALERGRADQMRCVGGGGRDLGRVFCCSRFRSPLVRGVEEGRERPRFITSLLFIPLDLVRNSMGRRVSASYTSLLCLRNPLNSPPTPPTLPAPPQQGPVTNPRVGQVPPRVRAGGERQAGGQLERQDAGGLGVANAES